MLCLWPIWARLPARRVLTEREISTLIDAECPFRDAASIRRFMVGEVMLSRNPDGSEYRRVEQAPGPTQRAVIAEVGR